MHENSNKSMLILIAGPYRSGTNDDPALMRKNVQIMESYALPIFRAGHIPIIGEWLALPLVDLAGSKRVLRLVSCWNDCLTGGIDQTVRPITRSLRGWSGEATDRSMPSDNVPTPARVGTGTAREQCICQHRAERG
jgi:hypothetical protein